jgi:GT2 family glycosyltransferase
MKISSITITYNDDYKFDEWCQHYSEYKDELSQHIIVDNGSNKAYLDRVRSFFKDSILIERQSNGGTTRAYNDGISLALKDKSVGAIMLIANDMRIKKGSIAPLYEYLNSDERFGIVAPVMLKKDSQKIEGYGDVINYFGMISVPEKNQYISDVPKSKVVSIVQGGINMARRSFYQKVGLQDSKLFMYGDEIDMYFRMKKFGFISGVTTDSVSWHQHINYPCSNDMSADMAYLYSRNRIYIIKKHLGIKGLPLFAHMLFFDLAVFFRDILLKKTRRVYWYKLKGIWAGINGNMDNSFLQ